MALDNGYIKLHRAILNWEWYDDPVTTRVFMHLLLTANIKSNKYQGYEIPEGSRVFSYSKLADETNLSVRNVRTAINHLKSTGEVTSSRTPKFSIISIVNWATYQGNRQGKRQAADKEATSDRQHNKNIRRKEYSVDKHKSLSTEREKGEKTVSKYADWNDAWD